MKNHVSNRISLKGLFFLFLFYLFFSILYYITLSINDGSYYENGILSLFNFSRFLKESGLQYSILFLLSLPIWLLIFKVLNRNNTAYVLIAHALILPIFITVSRKVFYIFCDHLGWNHLIGTSTVWDLYLPSLIYFIQFGMLHAYEHYKENQKKLVLEGQLRQAALKSELSAIRAQLNPHFLYNVFNTITEAVSSKNKKARNMITQLSDMFRYLLETSNKDLVPLHKELSFIEKYLNLEKERFEERMNYKIDVEEELMQYSIPPMILQPLIENSIKHGLSKLVEGGTINIRVHHKDNKLNFEISDTGVGIKNKQVVFEKGIGLTNTRNRLRKRYNSELKLLDNNPRGLKIIFSI